MKKVVLIYDDEEEILQLCKIILGGANFKVETLSRCDDVIGDIEHLQPDIILMDLLIPSMGGEKAIRTIKQNISSEKIPVLVFSANADIKKISESINADGYLEKPFVIKTLIGTIQRYLD